VLHFWCGIRVRRIYASRRGADEERGPQGERKTMPTQKRIGRNQQLYMCPCCKGTGELSKKECGLVAWMFECADRTLKVQKHIQAAQVNEREIPAAHEAYLTALVEPEEAWKPIATE
jgi:hypothetical protein